jgi:hypothetical protein
MSRWRLGAAVLAALIITSLAAVSAQTNRTGALAVIGTDGNVSLIAGDGTVRALTDDAGADGDVLRFYQWPLWSRSGAIGFFGVELTRQGDSALEAWVAPDAATPEQVYRAADETYTYAYWTPAPCSEGGLCDSIATLISRRSGDGFGLTLISADGTDAQLVGEGAPFYFDWSPDGTQMAWHRGDSRLDVYDLEQGTIGRTLSDQPGIFTAPAYAPDGSGALLIGIGDTASQSTALVVQRAETQLTLVTGLQGAVSFAWSPDSEQVAYREQGGPLLVLDAATGDELARTPSAGILAFFWSPIGRQLAFVTVDSTPAGSFSAKRAVAPAQQSDPTRLLWSVLHVDDGSVTRAASFVPTRDMVYLLSYFDQFSLSHRIWSPDGTRLAYGDLVTPEQPVVQVLDLSVPGARPQAIAPGVIGIWSFN